VYRGLQQLVGAYLNEMRQVGAEFGNLLSGGVDSSFTQLLINEHLAGSQARSYSYLMHARSFEPEVEYARQAQLAFNTEHTFVDIQPDDYPALLVRSIEILGQPVHSAMEPCRLAVAEFLASAPHSPRYYFSALGGDRLFGLNMARKIKWLDLASQIPASPLLMGVAGRLLRPVTPRGRSLQKAAQMLRDRNHLSAPINTTGISADFGLALDSFGMETVERVFELRRAQVLEYLDSSNYQEKAHFAGFIDTTMDEANEGATFFQTHGQEQVYPFLDEDAFRTSLVIRPEERYIRGFRVKPILKQLLEQRSSSPAPRLPKLGSSFNPDVHIWMDRGPLRAMVRAIERPGFLSKSDLERLIEQPNYFFLWALLTFDIFNKRILKRL
jgi:asparagine synthetase B (glutamine-hydrolysing)